MERVAIARESNVELENLLRFSEAAFQAIKDERLPTMEGFKLPGWTAFPPEKSANHLFQSEAQARNTHGLLRRFMAAECSAFLRGANRHTERWKPYVRWAEIVKANSHMVVTFNYDRVPETLDLAVPRPQDAHVGGVPRHVLKMHGSTNWHMKSAAEVGRTELDEPDAFVDKPEPGIASPGPDKQDMCSASGAFKGLWDNAEAAIALAKALVIVGYSFPPSDAFTRDRLFTWIGRNLAKRSSRDPLIVHTVLGADINSHDSKRIEGMLRAVQPDYIRNKEGGTLNLQQWPLWAEDFLALVDHDRILSQT